MAEEEFDVEALLEAPYLNGGAKADEPKQPQSQPEPSSSSVKKRSRSRSHPRQESSSKRDREHNKDRERSDRDRNRDRDRDRDRDRASTRESGRGDRHRDRDNGRSDRDRDRERDRDRDRDRGRDDRRDTDRRYNDDRRDRDRRHDRDRREDRRRSRSRSPDRRRDDGDRRRKSRSPRQSPAAAVKKPNLPELTPEERDARTVICMQLASRIRPEDLEEFFSSVGKVTDVRLVTDRKRKSKGIAYVEFGEVESVSLAIALTGQKLLGVPIVVQLSHAEKNRLAAMQAAAAAAAAQAAGEASGAVGNAVPGAAKLYVGSLHQNITEDMLRAIFEPFGKLLDVSIVRDQKTAVSQGFAFITFRNAEDANTALVQMNGFPLAGRPLKVGRSERSAVFPDIGEIDKIGALVTSPGGINALAAATTVAAGFALDPTALALGAPAGLGLSAGLGIGAPVGLGGLGIDPATAALMGSAVAGMAGAGLATQVAPPISTQCLMISNAFDPTQQLLFGWDTKLCDDIIQESGRNGATVTHIAVDRQSAQGNVYVKCDSVAGALLAVNALHGRLFDGRVLAVNYVPTDIYHSLFPGAVNASPAAVVRE